MFFYALHFFSSFLYVFGYSLKIFQHYCLKGYFIREAKINLNKKHSYKISVLHWNKTKDDSSFDKPIVIFKQINKYKEYHSTSVWMWCEFVESIVTFYSEIKLYLK